MALLIVFLVACTGQPTAGPPTPGAAPSPSAGPAEAGPALPVVVGPGAHGSYLDGMKLAASETGTLLDVRETDVPPDTVREAVGAGPSVVFVIGEADAVAEARPDIEAARVPVVLLGEDLYSSRRLFRYAFQTAVPLLWQARVLARYLVVDREHERIAVVGDEGVESEALAEEGAAPTASIQDADAVLALGSRRGASGQGQVATSNAALLRPGLPPGSVTCVPYTWAGWADMLPRVHRFRARFERATGHPPVGFEQEGYDAVRAVAEALERTGGTGGDALLRTLESYRKETYSSLPIRLGPDDHVFAEESQLGLFAVADPGEGPFPGEVLAAVPWRPIMRTFTTDGQKVNLLGRDKKVFFPGWDRRKPSPRYWKSRFGIVTRPDEDPLH